MQSAESREARRVKHAIGCGLLSSLIRSTTLKSVPFQSLYIILKYKHTEKMDQLIIKISSKKYSSPIKKSFK